MTRILAIDIGNTNTVVGLFRSDLLEGTWRISTHLHRTPDEYGFLLRDLIAHSGIRDMVVEGAILSSVVPPLTPIFKETCRTSFGVEPVEVTSDTVTGLVLRVDRPEEVGADRIVNAAAVYAKFRHDAIIVDFGTATTFCAVSGTGDYLGGVIVPGITLSAEALYKRTAKLPRVELARPPNVIGKNTVHSIQSGLLFGYAGMVDALVGRVMMEMGVKPAVIATGGLASLVAPETKSIEKVEPFLTLEGLKVIYCLNKGKPD
jgi:type III pantothenate kinase